MHLNIDIYGNVLYKCIIYHYAVKPANMNLDYFQFFITLGDDLDYLDGVHTVFAEVVEGFDVLDKLNDAICDDDHRPYQDIR